MGVYSRTLFSLIFLTVVVFYIIPGASAEEFRAYRTFKGFDDTSAVQESEYISVDISRLTRDEDKALRVGSEVIKSELKGAGLAPGRVVFVLDSVSRRLDGWYLKYKWEYASAVLAGIKPKRFFNERVDLKKRVVVHERSADDQFTGPGAGYVPGQGMYAGTQ